VIYFGDGPRILKFSATTSALPEKVLEQKDHVGVTVEQSKVGKEKEKTLEHPTTHETPSWILK
jgi:hypothetical protein